MSTFIESLRRLFLLGKITTEKLQELQKNKKITDEEVAYITAEKLGGGVLRLINNTFRGCCYA